VFSFDDLERSGAFLATHMSGEPLSLDHGAPVRLIVPGWYGCACIKWVNEPRYVGVEEPATSQMTEFASRTHQDGAPELARDFLPAEIDVAAMLSGHRAPSGDRINLIGRSRCAAAWLRIEVGARWSLALCSVNASPSRS
jgi:DMSO/TMAO reductase YedYZ molybdopterin-dependent catalytic subunit